MAKQGIGTGSAANDGTGDSLRSAGGKINANFDEIYSLLTGASNSGTTLLAGIVTSVTAGSNVTLSAATGQVEISASVPGGTGFFVQNTTGINTTGTLGNVGIGTTTASSRLTVDGTVKITGITTIDSSLQQTGSATFSDDVTFTGDSANVFWDKSQNQLEFADNAKAIFGNSTDFQIYHDGSNSYIQDSGTGDLIIYGSGETLAKFVDDGGVELYFNNTKTFNTVGTGISVIGDSRVTGISTLDGGVITGTASTVGFGSTAYFKDNAKLSFGAGADLDIWHDGSHSYIKDTKASGNLYIQGSTILLNNQANTQTLIKASEGGAVEAYYAGTKTLETTATGILVGTAASVHNNGNAAFAGIVTANGGLLVGTAVTIGQHGGNAGFTGIVTAQKFIGDGSGLTGVTGSGSGVIVEDSGSAVGTAGTINFSDNLSVTPIHLGVCTITASGGSTIPGISTTGGADFTNLSASGISTFTGNVQTGSAATVGFGTSAFFVDDAALFFGSDSDLKIHHDGSNSIFDEVGTGNLQVKLGGSTKLDVNVGGVTVTGVQTATTFSATDTNSGLITSRYDFTGTTDSLANNGIGNTEFSGYKSYAVLKVGTSEAAWVRLYTDDASRTSDATRSVGEDPTAGSGVIIDVVTSAASTSVQMSPYALGGNAGAATTVFAAITNQTGVTTTLNYTLTLLQLEV